MSSAMLTYDQPLYRPPSEARNLIIQVTLGCSFNQCSFCSMYHTKTFSARPLEQVFRDIDEAARLAPETSRVFLADGDALVLPCDHLLKILHKLHETFPALARVTSYALPANLRKKTRRELETLHSAGLKLLYYGIESGSADILRKITKGATPHGMVDGLNKARDAGMKISATVILGLGGRKLWKKHIDETAKLVNRTRLNFLSTLQLGLDRDVEDEFYRRFKEPFEWQDDRDMLHEQIRLIEAIDPPSPIIFRSNHASNALALKGNLPKDGPKLVAQIASALNGHTALRPHWMRKMIGEGGSTEPGSISSPHCNSDLIGM